MKHKALIAILLATHLAGCASYTPGTATSSHLVNYKMGTACNGWVLFPNPLFTWWGRNDIMTAAKEGGIEKIAVVDHVTRWYVIYGESCTVVYGSPGDLRN